MTDQQLEAAFNEAQAQWLQANHSMPYSDTQQRYFFFEGSQFGLQATADIYRETFGRLEEIVGEPV